VDDDFLVLAGPPPCPVHRPPDVEIVVVDEDAPVALIRETMDVNERGFDPSAPRVTNEQAEQFRPQLRGARAITVRAGGRPVAAGMVLPVRAGVAELAGIATLVPDRHRGLGRLATETLAGIAFELGADMVILSTDNAEARRLYTRVGFVSTSM
jgi:predicted GNAT family acetyltransferase